MLIEHNHFRRYRKEFQLTRENITVVFGLTATTHISRLEQGQRKPKIKLLLLHHILFGIPIEAFFERQKEELVQNIKDRVVTRLEQLTEEDIETSEEYCISFFTPFLHV